MSEAHRVEVPVGPTDQDRAAAWLWALGAQGIWEQPGRLVAWVTDPRLAEDDHLVRLASGRVLVRPEEDRDWQAAWKATVQPVHAGRTVVVPTWLADGHTPAADELTLVLDPGQAFGTGHHATTALCLELLDDLDLDGGLGGRTVADVGCGSGILAIAAAARGAEVVAIDLDPDAVAVTRTNAAMNGVEVHAKVGAVERLAVAADVVVANLISDVVRDNAAALVDAATDHLVVSGITEERAEEVLAALRAQGAEVLEVRRRDGWIAAMLATSRRGGPAALPAPDGTVSRRGRGHRMGLLLTLLVVALGLLAAGCSEPEVLDPAGEEVEEEAVAEPAPPTPEEEALLGQVAAMADLLDEVDATLAEALEAPDLAGLRAAVARADRKLVVDPAVATPALFPSEDPARTEGRSAPDALTDTLATARSVGGALGRSVVEKLRDPIAGDLGAWERDAPGVLLNSRAAAAGAADEAGATDGVFALDGEGPRAIAWVTLAGETSELDLARAAVQRTRDHVQVMLIALELAVEPVGAGTPLPDDDPANEELGPSIDPELLEDEDAAPARQRP